MYAFQWTIGLLLGAVALTGLARRVGVPRDIANVVAFLCSDDASFVSGQIIYVKGGPETLR